MDEINTYIIAMKKLINSKRGYIARIVPRIEMNDGFSVSMQASCGHYCSPRDSNTIDDNVDEIHTAFELGYPSEIEELITEYAEDKTELTETAYGWVPLKTVLKLIKKHNGNNYKKTLEEYIKKRNI